LVALRSRSVEQLPSGRKKNWGGWKSAKFDTVYIYIYTVSKFANFIYTVSKFADFQTPQLLGGRKTIARHSSSAARPMHTAAARICPLDPQLTSSKREAAEQTV